MTTSLPARFRFTRSALSLLLGIAAAAHAGVTPMNVTVYDSEGQRHFSGVTGGEGSFATNVLEPGRYVVHFAAKRAELDAPDYATVISAGRTKVLAIGTPAAL